MIDRALGPVLLLPVKNILGKGICLVPIKRMIVLAVSSIMLCTIFITMRGISNVPADLPSVGNMLITDHSTSEKGSTRQVELEVEVSLSGDAFEVLQALNRTFMTLYPDITVALQNIPVDERYERLSRSFRMENAPDLILMDNEAVMQYAIKAQLQPTDDFFTSDTETQYLPAVIQQLTWNGYIWGVPFQVQPYILAYHEQAWYEMTGEVMPSSIEQVWDAYRNRALLIYDDDPLAYAALADALDHSWQFPSAMHVEGAIIDDEAVAQEEVTGLSAELIIEVTNTEQVTDTDDRMVNLATETLSEDQAAVRDMVGMPSLDPAESGDEWDRLLRGEIVGLITTLHAYEAYRTDFIASSILPSVDRSGSLFMSGKSFVLSSDTVNQEAAFLWLHELTKHYNLIYERKSLGAYPANNRAYADAAQKIPSPYTSLRNAIDKGKAPSPDPFLRAKLPIVREQLVAAQQMNAEITDVMLQLSRHFTATGMLIP